MASTVFNFLLTVPIENTVLRAVIMVAEMLLVGIALYYLWELALRLSVKRSSSAKARHQTAADSTPQDTTATRPAEKDVVVEPAAERMANLVAKSTTPVNMPGERTVATTSGSNPAPLTQMSTTKGSTLVNHINPKS